MAERLFAELPRDREVTLAWAGHAAGLPGGYLPRVAHELARAGLVRLRHATGDRLLLRRVPHASA